MATLTNKQEETGTRAFNDEELDNVSGGVQAGSILKGGAGEFPKKPKEPVKPKYKPYL